jgi:hypothetical protein
MFPIAATISVRSPTRPGSGLLPMPAPKRGVKIKARQRSTECTPMTNREDFNHQVRRAAILTLALVACLGFGIILLANSDWVPGGIIIAATVAGLAREIPVIRKLCSTESVMPPKSRHVS